MIIPFSVNAADGFQMKGTTYKICDENNMVYPVNFITYKYYSVYYLNYNQNFNYNFLDYHEYEINQEFYDKYIQKYLWIQPAVNYQTFYNYHQQFVTRYFWEKLYPEKTFYFCGEDESVINQKEEEYFEVKKRVDKVIDGIDLFKETHIQNPDEDIAYLDDYLALYTLVDDNGLNVSKKKNKLTISGKPGNYNLVFHIIDNNAGEKAVLTDGTNRMATMPHSPKDDYVMQITIKPYILNVSFNNGEAREVCFKLTSSTVSDEKCTLNDHLAFEVINDEYELSLINNEIYEDYHQELNIDNNTDTEIVLIKKDNETIYVNTSDNEEELITFVAKNTFMSIDNIH